MVELRRCVVNGGRLGHDVTETWYISNDQRAGDVHGVPHGREAAMNTWTTKDQIVHELVSERVLVVGSGPARTRLSLRCRPMVALSHPLGNRSNKPVSCLECLAAERPTYVEFPGAT